MTFSMRLAAAAVVLISAAAVATFAEAKPLKITLPEEIAAFKPGPNREAAMTNCTACHSSDYIQTQPRGAKFGKDFWTAEVNKMIKVYGAPIEDADIPKIVEYLTATYQ